MIKSMTGFASLTHEDERATIGITIRAVNHRFLDLQLRIPQSLADLEPRVRSLLQKRLARGRVELAISMQVRQASAPTVELNADFANALTAVIEQARAQGLVSGQLTPGDLLRLPQALTIRERLSAATVVSVMRWVHSRSAHSHRMSNVIGPAATCCSRSSTRSFISRKRASFDASRFSRSDTG